MGPIISISRLRRIVLWESWSLITFLWLSVRRTWLHLRLQSREISWLCRSKCLEYVRALLLVEDVLLRVLPLEKIPQRRLTPENFILLRRELLETAELLALKPLPHPHGIGSKSLPIFEVTFLLLRTLLRVHI